jgi:hypothetical protein
MATQTDPRLHVSEVGDSASVSSPMHLRHKTSSVGDLRKLAGFMKYAFIPLLFFFGSLRLF